jgi:peptide/nickel transport system ATP-binding protein
LGSQIADLYRIHEPHATLDEIYEKAGRILLLLNLTDRIYKMYPHEMSGGMLQRVSIAVSLLHEPDLVILDEATTALDVVTQGQILAELKRMESELSTSRIIITHDMSVVAASCNQIAVMYAGRMVESGDASEVLSHPAHPYTEGLIHAFPPLHGEKVTLTSIPGYLPDLSQLPQGCVFAPRCSRAVASCHTLQPEMVSLGDAHLVACHQAKEGSI